MVAGLGLREAVRVAVCAVVAGVGVPGASGAAPGDPAAAIRGVIAAQIDAFRRGDAGAAFALASPRIEAKFGSPARFMAVVATGYPAVYRVHDYGFGPLVRDGGISVQQVNLVGADGTRTVAFYSMEHERDGWRIDGCQLAPDQSEGI